MKKQVFFARNWATQIGNATVITRAYIKENAVKFMQAKDATISYKDVYEYDGITGATPIDEVYIEAVREQNGKGELVWNEIEHVRLREEYAHLA